MRKPTIDEHLQQITQTTCTHCEFANLNQATVSMYDHENGWPVEGWTEKQWLYIVCPMCKYEWALWKLGVGTKWHELKRTSE